MWISRVVWACVKASQTTVDTLQIKSSWEKRAHQFSSTFRRIVCLWIFSIFILSYVFANLHSGWSVLEPPKFSWNVLAHTWLWHPVVQKPFPHSALSMHRILLDRERNSKSGNKVLQHIRCRRKTSKSVVCAYLVKILCWKDQKIIVIV